MIPLRFPWLLIAFIADLAAIVLVALTGDVETVKSLELHTIALGLGGAVAGAQLPVGQSTT